ncbi:MAG: cytochrome c [marine benthic group bacterium]|jgi:mono/diheme cytochrome c family protein|nr:cytochrome c [Candidatus Benthicola marisminoris]
MEKNIWRLMLVALVAVGLSACSGDANANGGDEAADAAPAQAEVTAAPEAEMEMAEADAMPQELPEGVTEAMIEEGKGIYSGAGICMSCHGPAGEGIPNLGANLVDDEWIHIDGSYEQIVENIMSGVTAQESSSGVPMPAKGGTAITDDQVKAVAAYVWTLSQ